MDIEQIIQDEALFAHLIDEVLPFEQDLKTSLGYPNSYPSVVSVLVQPVFFVKWMAIEKKCMYCWPDFVTDICNRPPSFHSHHG